MDIFAILSLIGGLALFLYGMNVMGDGLTKVSGGKLEKILEKLTSNPIKAVLLGAGTTIMASAGAQCNHVNHVTTQLPYAATVAVVSCITYVIAGFVQNALICLPIGMVLLVAALLLMKKRTESHS